VGVNESGNTLRKPMLVEVVPIRLLDRASPSACGIYGTAWAIGTESAGFGIGIISQNLDDLEI
jgi:hypothetical protein